jgi:uncharacterized protein YlxP (DUF503 family)
MIVAVARVELLLPGVRSLKEKRKVIKQMVDRLHSRYRVSVAETSLHDLHQRAEVGIALVSGRTERAVEALSACRRIVEETHGSELLLWEQDLIEDGP